VRKWRHPPPLPQFKAPHAARWLVLEPSMCRYKRPGRGGGRKEEEEEAFSLAQEPGGGRPSSPRFPESNEVKGVKVSGSRMRTRLSAGRSNLWRAAATARRVGERLCIYVKRTFERRGSVEKKMIKHQISCCLKYNNGAMSSALIWLASTSTAKTSRSRELRHVEVSRYDSRTFMPAYTRSCVSTVMTYALVSFKCHECV